MNYSDIIYLIGIRGKEFAVFYYPELFDETYNLKDCSLDEIDKVVKNKKKEIETTEPYRMGQVDHASSRLLEEHSRKYKPKSEMAINIYNAYTELTREIANYKFNPQTDENTVGKKENDANKHILFTISLFYPLLMFILKAIDTLYDSKWKGIQEAFDTEGQEFIDMLNNAKTKLLNAHNEYSHASHIDYGLSRQKANEWKHTRNYACQTILSFYKCIKESSLNNDDQIEHYRFLFRVMENTIYYDKSKKYDKIIEFIITKSPYRFSFLKPDEQGKLIGDSKRFVRTRKKGSDN